MQENVLQLDLNSIVQNATMFLEKMLNGTIEMLKKSTESLSAMF